MFRRSCCRFAHSAGFCHTSYSENGEQIITSGSNDGDIRIWRGISDDDPNSHCIGESANCAIVVQFKDNKTSRLIAAADNNIVQGFFFPGVEREGVLMRFKAAVTTLSCNDEWIAAGSDDFTIKIQKRQATDESIELKGHTGPILHIDVSSKAQLASSSGDGTIRVWSLSETPITIKTFDGFEKANEFSQAKIFSTPSFDPAGNFLAFPKGNSIQVVDTSSWEPIFKLENENVTGRFTVCRFSPKDGAFLAAGSFEGEISVWNCTQKSKSALQGQIKGEDLHAITSLAWNPKNNGELSFCDVDGQLSTITVSSASEILEEDEKVADEDEVDDLYDRIDFHGSDDDGKVKEDSEDSDEDDDETVKSLPVVKAFVVQPPFQPGSTPGHLEHRFMVWNHIGQVLCHSTDENSIIAEFHDVSVHPSIHILNNLNHEMASLSATCLALATKETPCRLVCIAFISAGSKEWGTTMPDCEVISGIAAGGSFVAVATDALLVRFFTTMGTQREVVAVSGPVVAMSAYENKLAVVYHTSNTRNKFSLMLITLIGASMSSRVVKLPLTADSKLAWLGFSDMGSVIAYDTAGRVVSYCGKRNIFYPIGDMNNHTLGASDSIFIVSVSESDQKIRATMCGGTKYPLTSPKPILREIEFSLPLCYMETEKSKLEEALVRAVTFNMEASEKTIVEKGLKLFSSAINAELESRAFEIVELISNKKLTELASKYASQKGRIHLSNKISKLLTDSMEKEKQRQLLMSSLEQDDEKLAEAFDVQVSNIKASKTSTPIPAIAPKPMISQNKANPFKKSDAGRKTNTPTSSLTHLMKKSIGQRDSNNIDASDNFDDSENTPTNNASRSISTDTPRPGNFTQWFIGNKADLKANNPQLPDTELMKIGKNIYKELTQKMKNPDDAADEPPTSFNKRKLYAKEEDGGITKLAKYSFAQD